MEAKGLAGGRRRLEAKQYEAKRLVEGEIVFWRCNDWS